MRAPAPAVKEPLLAAVMEEKGLEKALIWKPLKVEPCRVRL